MNKGLLPRTNTQSVYVGPQIGTAPVLALEPILAPVLELEPHGSRFHTGPPSSGSGSPVLELEPKI